MPYYNDDYKEDEAKDNIFSTHWDWIVQNFDWNKVHKTMIALDWKWFFNDIVPEGIEGNMRTPSINEMKHLAEDLLYKVYIDETIKMSAKGGFEAIREDDELSLSFVIDQIQVTDNDFL